MSTLCECLLVLCALVGGLAAARGRHWAVAGGFALFALAALLGAIEYAGVSAVVVAHAELTRIAAWLALPLMATPRQSLGRLSWLVVAFAIAGLCFARSDGPSLWTNGAALALIIVEAARRGVTEASLIVLGVGVLLLANLALPETVALPFLARRDFYHLLLCVALFLLQMPYHRAARADGAALVHRRGTVEVA